MPLNNLGQVYSYSEDGLTRLYRSAQPDADAFRIINEDLKIKVIIRLSHSYEGGVTLEQEKSWFFGQVINQELPEMFRLGELKKVEYISSLVDYYLRLKLAVLVHCSHGRDRTGVVIGAWQLIYDGKTLEQIEQERSLYGVHGLISLLDYPDKKILQEIAGKAG